MLKLLYTSLSRRMLLTGLATSALSPRQISSRSQRGAIQLGYGIEIRDFRLFPSPDIMRFIVEIHNSTDSPVDTPTIGVVLPHLDVGENYGWASPAQLVLHAHTSGIVIGVAPGGLVQNGEWGTPDWFLCAPPVTNQSAKLAQWNIDISQQLAVNDARSLSVFMWVTNLGDRTASDITINGILRDESGRICGVTTSVWIQGLEQGETTELGILVAPNEVSKYIANPFTLINTVVGLETTLTLQPTPSFTFPQCDLAMPWNR